MTWGPFGSRRLPFINWRVYETPFQLWEAAFWRITQTNGAQVDTSPNYRLSDKRLLLEAQNAWQASYRGSHPEAQGVEIPSQALIFKKQMFPNGAQRESWAATKVSHLADVRAGLSTASEASEEAQGHTPAWDTTHSAPLSWFLDSSFLFSWGVWSTIWSF